tara:strand:- start:1083 stop:1661 length:579 start_codon:yes stop_codon:yes gene_type:complete
MSNDIARKIVDHIIEEDAINANESIKEALYINAGSILGESTPMSVERSFRDIVVEEQSPEQKAFRDLFDKILKKHGADSPNDLEDSKKDDFFNEVEREWKKDPANKPEKNESTVNESDGSFNPFDFRRRQDEYFYRKFWEFMKPFLRPTDPNIPDGTPEPAPHRDEYRHGTRPDYTTPGYQNQPSSPLVPKN